ncbi:uncharacterized protein [Drosophila takahashii]|uniref:uncharacterized protein n=1 Tax=Drosophila takahashii TaxID=29030 RepID=UPI001CF805D4|nr:uncharacterized protein LOC108065193 [Drosophila takahashii]
METANITSFPQEILDLLFESLDYQDRLSLAQSNHYIGESFASFCKRELKDLELTECKTENDYLSRVLPICGSAVMSITAEDGSYPMLQILERYCTNVKSVVLKARSLWPFYFIPNMKSLTSVQLWMRRDEDDFLYPALQELPHLTNLHLLDFSEKNVHKVQRLVNLERLSLERGRKECPVDIMQICHFLKKLDYLFIECDEIFCGTYSQGSTCSALEEFELIVKKVTDLPFFPNLRKVFVLSDKSFNWIKWITKYTEKLESLYISNITDNIGLLDMLESCKVLHYLAIFIESTKLSNEYLTYLVDVARRKVGSLSLEVKTKEEVDNLKKRLADIPNSAICKVYKHSV